METLKLFGEFSMVAGDYQELHFTINDQNEQPIDLKTMKSIQLKLSTTGVPRKEILVKDGNIYNVNNVSFKLESDETKTFSGKYLFQIIITNSDSKTLHVPSQGTIDIYPQIGVQG